MATNTHNVLVVEDNLDFRYVLCQMLEILGYSAQDVTTAEEAVEPLKSGQFNLLLTDLSLPGMSGFDLANLALDIAPGIKVIIASGYGNPKEDLSASPFVYLLKPYNLAQLKSALEKV